MNPVIPKWITVVSVLIVLMGLFVGASLYYAPGAFVKHIDFSAPAILFLPRMWAARQIAIVLVIGYSVAKQSAPMLRVTLGAYCLMTFQDIFIGLMQHDTGVILGSGIACVLSATMIYLLRERPSGI